MSGFKGLRYKAPLSSIWKWVSNISKLSGLIEKTRVGFGLLMHFVTRSYLKRWSEDRGGLQNGIHEMVRGWGGSLKDKRIRGGFATNCKHNTHTARPDCKNHIMIIDHITKKNQFIFWENIVWGWSFIEFSQHIKLLGPLLDNIL